MHWIDKAKFYEGCWHDDKFHGIARVTNRENEITYRIYEHGEK